jgi:hypothetical protein
MPELRPEGFYKKIIRKCSSQSAFRSALQSERNGPAHAKKASATESHPPKVDEFQLPADPSVVAKDTHKTAPTLPHATANYDEVRHFLYSVLTYKAFGLAQVCPQWILETCWSWRGRGQKLLDLDENAMGICPRNAGAAPIDPSKYEIEAVPSREVRAMIGNAVREAISRCIERELYQPMVEEWNADLERSVARYRSAIDVPSDHPIWQGRVPRERNPYHSSDGDVTRAWVSTLEDTASGSSFPIPSSPPLVVGESLRQSSVNTRVIDSPSTPSHPRTSSRTSMRSRSGAQFRSAQRGYEYGSSFAKGEDKGYEKDTGQPGFRSHQIPTIGSVTSLSRQDVESSAVSPQTLSNLRGRHASLCLMQDYDNELYGDRYRYLGQRSTSYQRSYRTASSRHNAIDDLPPQQIHRKRSHVNLRQEMTSSPRPPSRMSNHTNYSRSRAEGIATFEPIYLAPDHQVRPESRAGGPQWQEGPPSRIAFAPEPERQHRHEPRPTSRTPHLSGLKHESRPASRVSHKSVVSQRSSTQPQIGRPLNNKCIEEFTAMRAEQIVKSHELLSGARERMKALSMQDLRGTREVRSNAQESGFRREDSLALKKKTSTLTKYETIAELERMGKEERPKPSVG